ncbi:hypothetical protein LCGC14_2335990, partial [marine sediment metagenome]
KLDAMILKTDKLHDVDGEQNIVLSRINTIAKRNEKDIAGLGKDIKDYLKAASQ